MPTLGQIGSGVKIAYASSSPQTWTTVPEVRELSGLPNRERDQVETTIHGVTGDRTFIGGLATVQTLEFTLRANLDSGSVHTALRAKEISQEELWWRVEVPVDPTLATSTYVAYTLQGRVSKWDLTAPIDALKEIQVSVQYSGSWMFQEEMASLIT